MVLRVVNTVLPEGTVKKYSSFIVSCVVMLILITSVTTSGNFDFSFPDEGEVTVDAEDLERVKKLQIEQEFSRQLIEDMKKTFPTLKSADIGFSFNINEDGTGYVTEMTIESCYDKNDVIIMRISELYGIDENIITWRKV